MCCRSLLGQVAMEEATEQQPSGDHGIHLPFARGGPVYVPDLVGPLTSVFEFKASVLHELKCLESALASSSSPTGDFNDELSVDELRVFTEEELVEKAFAEGFEDALVPADSPKPPLECGDEGVVAGREIVPGPSAALNGSSLACDSDVSVKKVQQKKGKKRGRLFDRDTRAAELEGSYFAKVRQLAKLKKKQDDDKLAARLHSFSGNHKSVEDAIPASDKIGKKRSLRFITSPVKVKLCSSQAHASLCYPEVVLCVEIYHKKRTTAKALPLSGICMLSNRLFYQNFDTHNFIEQLFRSMTQEFLVLGSQTLSDLRDNIYCLTDKLMQTTGQYDPSGYFLIEDSICNDMRNPSATDYSEPIFNWLKTSKNEAVQKWEAIMSVVLKNKLKKLVGQLDISNLPHFRALDMHRTRFCDLRFRLGSGYLYCHQAAQLVHLVDSSLPSDLEASLTTAAYCFDNLAKGNCKHILVIRDMRLIHPADVQNRLDYPLLTFQLQQRHRKCSACHIYHATKMTLDDKWAQKNPCYFCINCYFLLHYNEDGSLLYPHSVFDYYHD